MALKFRHLSVPQAKQALRHRVVNSTDLISSQSSSERRDAVGQCGDDTRRHSRLQLDTIPRNRRHWRRRHPTGVYPRCFSRLKGILFGKPHLRAELRHRSFFCVFCRNMNSIASVGVGGTGSIRTNVRVIAATTRDLKAAIAAGTFRSDLFYWLDVSKTTNPSADRI